MGVEVENRHKQKLKILRISRQSVYLTCLDLGRSGALFTSGWDRQIQKSGDEAKDLKHQINTQWIYPPTGMREQILAAIRDSA